jgi:hypothetical protein
MSIPRAVARRDSEYMYSLLKYDAVLLQHMQFVLDSGPLFLQLGRVDTNQSIYGDVKYLLTTLPGNNGDHGSSLCEKQEC